MELIAKVKEKGFLDWYNIKPLCIGMANKKDGILYKIDFDSLNKDMKLMYIQKWLRQKYNIDVLVGFYLHDGLKIYTYHIYNNSNDDLSEDEDRFYKWMQSENRDDILYKDYGYISHEKALEVGLEKGIELIK